MDNIDRLIQLEFLLRQGSVFDRKTALDQLVQFPTEQAVPILHRLSTDPDFLCRRFAVMGLGNHRTAASLAILKDLLDQEQDDSVLSEVANAIFEFGDQSIPLLQKLFERNHHWLTRQTILSILIEAKQDHVLLVVIREALQDETQTVKETAILALGSLLNGQYEEEVLDLLTELAEAEFWRDRWRTATTLSISSNPRAKPLLAKLQQDPKHYVVAAALEAALPK